MSQIDQLANQFRGFPEKYSFAPLWFWNDELYEEEIARQLRLMKDQHVNETIVWTNAGMNQRYLSPEYLDLFAFATDEAKRLGMHIWIYDDWSWPSGLAGGIINEAHAHYLMTACRVYRYDVAEGGDRDLVRRLPVGRVLRAEAERVGDGQVLDVTDHCDDASLRWHAPDGGWRVYVAVVTPLQKILDPTCTSRWGNWLPGYLDVMNRDAVAKFIELCHEAHYAKVGEHFGQTIKGFFTDEPGVHYDLEAFGGTEAIHTPGIGFKWKDKPKAHDHPDLHGFCGSVPWSADLLYEFRHRRGYDLRPRVLDLMRLGEGNRKLAYDYYSLVSDLFAENWCEQIGEWCGQRGVAYSGHYGENVNGGDYYRQVKPMQVPGMDILGDHGAQMKDLMTLPRKIASVARMQGRERVLSEMYSDTSWDFNIHDKIRDADLMTVLGINTHASIDYTYSFRSIRKHTTNPAGFFQASNWDYNHHFADHVTRLCLMTAAGESTVSTAIVFGSHAALSNTLMDAAANAQLEKECDKTFRLLMAAQIESDVIFDTGLPEGSVEDGELIYPGAKYRTLLLAGVPMMREEHARVLVEFVKSGGTLVVLNTFPRMTPTGGDLTAVWRELTDPDRIDAASDVEHHDAGSGRVTLVPDFMRHVTSSEPARTGQKEAMFDGTDSMVVFPFCPQWVAMDFGRPLALTRFAMTVEAMKQGIEYVYTVEVSDDGETWDTAVQATQAALVHDHPLDVTARHLRLTVTEGGGRYVSLTDVTVMYRGEDGEERRWVPAGCDPLLMQRVLPDKTPTVELLDDDGQRVRSFTTAGRRLDGAEVLAVASRSPEEVTVTARLADAAQRVEVWDLDRGERHAVRVDDGSFRVTFAPYESRVFVVSDAAAKGVEVVATDRARETLAEAQGPLPFRPLRANAYPLVAAGLEMCDPARPDRWYPTENGSIPEPLRLVPFVNFRVTIPVDHVAGDERLLIEDGVLDHLAVNGRPVASDWTRDRYLDAFSSAAPIHELLKVGDNTFTGVFQPEMYERLMEGTWYHYDNIQPTLDAFVLGSFAVRDGRLVAPPSDLSSDGWETQGFQFYSGSAVYSVELDLPDQPEGPVWLEVDARNNVVELMRDGTSLGTRVTHPYLFDVTEHVASGASRFDLKITNPVGSLLSAQRTHSWKGKIDLNFRSGLKWAKLVRPVA